MPKWVMILLGSLIGAGALAGLLYGVLTHKEPGLLHVCWVGGQAVYDGPCEPKMALRWAKERMPLRVFLDFPAVSSAAYRDSIVGAVQMWNQQVGPVFRLLEDREHADVLVSWGAQETGGHAGGFTRHKGGPDLAESAEVQLLEPSDLHAVMRYGAHELGHVLGLAHDDSAASLMHPTGRAGTIELQPLVPTDADKETLRYLYR